MELEPVDLSREYHGPLPELGRFRADPTAENHRAAAELLKRSGPLVLAGELFRLHDGQVVHGPAPDHSRGITLQ